MTVPIPLAIVQRHVEDADEAERPGQEGTQEHKGYEKPRQKFRPAEIPGRVKIDRDTFDEARKDRKHEKIQRRPVEKVDAARRSPIDADDGKAEKVEECDGQPPLHEGGQLLHGMAEAPEWILPEDVSAPVRLAAFRLLGRDHNPSLYAGNGLLIQGLLHVHREFCLAVHPDCGACALAASLSSTRGENMV